MVTRMPFQLQYAVLKRLGDKYARQSSMDPVLADEALDLLDDTLELSENRDLYFDELKKRGITIPPTPEQMAAEEEQAIDQALETLPEDVREYVVAWRREKTEALAEIKKMRERQRKILEEQKRWKDLSEVERARLSSEVEELKRSVEELTGGLPPDFIRGLSQVFLKLPNTSEEAFWAWLKDNMEFVRKQHGKVVPEGFEGYMKEYLGKKPALPPKPVVPPKPEAKFKMGSEVFELETGRKVVVRQHVWNELIGSYDYLVDDRGRIKRVGEEKLVPLPPLPAVERAPRVAVPRVLRAPPTPKTLEEITICPYTKHPLTRFTQPVVVSVEKPVTMAEQVRREMAGRPQWEIDAEARRREYTMREKGEYDREKVIGYERVPEKTPIPPGLLVYFDDKKDCPGYGKFYLVEDTRLRSMAYDELVERVRKFVSRISRPIIPLPRGRGFPTPLEEHYRTILNVERDPAFRKYVEEEVGLKWEAYLVSDGWSKDALRQSFAQKLLKGD